MKVLLDEDLDVKLRFRFGPAHQVSTVRHMNWLGKKNGKLLKLLVEHEFGAFLTADKKMRFEQNWRDYNVPVVFLDVPNLRYDTFKPLLPALLALLAQPDLAGGIHVLTPNS